jgi:hypothetical protein
MMLIGKASGHSLSSPSLIATNTFFGVKTQIYSGNFEDHVMVTKDGHEFRDIGFGEALSFHLTILDGKSSPNLAILSFKAAFSRVWNNQRADHGNAERFADAGKRASLVDIDMHGSTFAAGLTRHHPHSGKSGSAFRSERGVGD